jgi:diacylglycerol kinase (ATP)
VHLRERGARWRVLTTALRATSTGLGDQPTTTCYRFRTVASMPLQIDAELIVDPSTTRVTVQVAPVALSTVL